MKSKAIPALVALCLIPVPAAAQPAAPAEKAGSGPSILIQLNEAETVTGSCRLTFVVRNALREPVNALGLDLVLFDKSEGVAGYAAVDFGALPSGKTRVRQYDVAKGACSGISRVLLNDVRACEIQDAKNQDCLPLLRIESRSEIGLIL
jgi:hypothetical protein